MTKRHLAAFRRFYYINKHSCIIAGGTSFFLFCGSITVAALAAIDTPIAEEAKPYVVAAIVEGDASAEDAVTGIVQSSTPFQAGSVSGGRVLRLLAQIGDKVSAGTPLAILESHTARLRVAQANAEVRRAQAVASERESAANRATLLTTTGAISAAEWSSAEAEARAAQATLASAEAGLGLAREDARQTVIRAPGAGIVAARNIEIGGVATPGQILFTIEGASDRNILAAVPQKLATSLAVGARVRYSSEGVEGVARIVGVSPRIEDGGIVPVRLAIETGTPLPGAIVRLMLSVGKADATVTRVPATALQLRRDGLRFVYRLDRANRTVPVEVRLVGLSGNDARIVAALPRGSTVVAAGAAFLRPGQQVLIAKPGT